MSPARYAATVVAALVLASCSTGVVPRAETPSATPAPAPPPAAASPTVANALAAGVRPGPAYDTLALDAEDARAALVAFRLSCPALLKRSDASGLTRASDWSPACAVAPGWSDTDAAGFFRRHFETAVVGDGAAFATGYYEPEIAASRFRSAAYPVPIYRRPADLVEADLSLFSDQWKGKRIRGRIEDGKLIPYADRTAIEEGALAGRGLEIGYAADAIEFFFLQIQGSGRLRLPDGRIVRIGYDGQNGRDYVGIGGLMRQRGLLEPGQASMQGIMAWLRAHPEEGRAIMRENKSFIFFRELTGAGPIGAMGVAVTGHASVAADPAFVPLGAPVWLSLDRREANGLWVAQDTGGAIKGANRFDTFWGAGEQARTIAGGMSGKGRAVLLLPTGTLARLGSGGDAPAQH